MEPNRAEDESDLYDLLHLTRSVSPSFSSSFLLLLLLPFLLLLTGLLLLLALMLLLHSCSLISAHAVAASLAATAKTATTTTAAAAAAAVAAPISPAAAAAAAAAATAFLVARGQAAATSPTVSFCVSFCQASDEEIAASYRRLARLFHPDKAPEGGPEGAPYRAGSQGGPPLRGSQGGGSSGFFGGAPTAFVRLNQAYSILRNRTLREIYGETSNPKP